MTGTTDPRSDLRARLLDREVLVCTLYGETRGEPVAGQLAVASVICTRAKAPPMRFGGSVRAVCFAPAQFSCWWGPDPNTARVYRLAEALLSRTPLGAFDTDLLAQLQWIADGLLGGIVHDTGTANHYLTTALYQSPACPAWAQGQAPMATIGRHTFLSLP